MAARRADQLLRAAGMSWADLMNSYDRERVATQAAAILLSENESLRAGLEELSRRQPDWTPIGVPVGATRIRETAEWALGIHATGAIWLSELELGLLVTCTKWRTQQVTPKMQSILETIIDHIARKTGRRPP